MSEVRVQSGSHEGLLPLRDRNVSLHTQVAFLHECSQTVSNLSFLFCLRECVHAYVFTCVPVKHRLASGVVPQATSTLTVFLIGKRGLPTEPDQLASESPGICLLISLILGLQVHSTMPVFYMDPGGGTWVLITCMVNTLRAELSPHFFLLVSL